MQDVYHQLDNLKLAEFRFVFTVLETLHLPTYLGSTLRGGFGYAFKRTTCCNPQRDCQQCLLKERCIYSYVFEGFSHEGPKRYTGNTPHPFIIEPSDVSKSQYHEGETFEFNLILIGKAIDYLPYFIYTFDELGRLGIGKGKGKLNLTQVNNLPINSNEPVLIYDSNSKQLLNSSQLITIADILKQAANYRNYPHLTLNFLTPTRIKSQGRLVSTPDFDIFIGNLIRRLSSLLYFHCGGGMNIDYENLIEKAQAIKTTSSELDWYDWERYSSRQDRRMMLGGFMGRITYGGNGLEEFLPLILIGSLIHLGNNTTFGLGRYGVVMNKGDYSPQRHGEHGERKDKTTD
ncbi:MAG: CRISPR system precrRNA processing endoribonuclease RAMP protein Cas6 [Candidatus Desantisbacteria bacterium]